MCGDQQVECNGIHFINNNNTVEEPVVADISNIEYSRDLVSTALQSAHINIVNTSDLQATSDLSPTHIKLDNFQEPLSPDTIVDASGREVGMYRVDTSDKNERTVSTSLSNGNSSELSVHDDNITDTVKVANGDIPMLGRLASKELDVVLTLDSGEKRFGFSVIGGTDEGFPARVESIAGG